MRIALATVGTTGDIAPFVVLARALVARGHEVTVTTWPVHRSAFVVDGVHVEVAGPHADPARIASVAAEAAGRGPIDQVAVLRDFHLEGGAEHYARLRQLLRGHDLVVLHTIHSLAHAAALDENLRWATAAFDPVLLPTASAPPPGMPGLGPLNRLAWGMLDRMLGRTSKPLAELLDQAGSRHATIQLFRARSPLLHLVACSPSIIRIAPDWPPATRVTGAWLDSSTPDPLPIEIAAFTDGGRPPILFAFGSMAGAPDAALAAAAERVLRAWPATDRPGRRRGRGDVAEPAPHRFCGPSRAAAADLAGRASRRSRHDPRRLRCGQAIGGRAAHRRPALLG